MKGYYNIEGNKIILERENKQDVVLNIAEAIEIFATVADIQKMPFERDLIIEQMQDVLGV